jgi:hypothetical protein
LTNLIEQILSPLFLPLAFALSPWFLIRFLAPGASRPLALALTGAASLALNAAVPVALHLLGIPIRAASLAATHTLIFVPLAVAARLRLRPRLPPTSDLQPRLLWLAIALSVIVFPFTHLAGIDTYKWQDLATNVGVEQKVPWLTHPLSLAGFTPRSYPSVQPLVLASFQILGGLGVDGGFYAMSLLSGLTGLFAAAALGQRLFPLPAQAIWFAALYAFSPVFLRYNHWATGRGVFAALLPIFLLGFVKWPRWQSWLLIPASGILLVLSHKAGLVAVCVMGISAPLALMVPRRDFRWLRIAAILPFLAAAILLAGPLPHGVLGFARKAITRFGWYLPAAALAILAVRTWWANAAWRRIFPAAILSFPLAFHKEMYGAMLALPFICHAATAGLTFMFERWPTRSRILALTAGVLTALSGLAIVANRTMTATERRVWQAARFLEQYDPGGPFRIDAPGMARAQIQAYCSGCPRFEVAAAGPAQLAVRPPPPLRGPPAAVAQSWIDYLRHVFSAGDSEVSWYGHNPRFYLVTLDESGPVKPGMRVLYEKYGARVLAPAGQADPPGKGSAP